MRVQPRGVFVLLWLAPLILVVPCRAMARARIGAELGLNYSSLHYADLTQFPMSLWDPGWRSSFTGGATLQIPIRGPFDLVTGVRYVQQGNRVKFDDDLMLPPLHGEFRIYQDYVSVPALLTYYPSARKSFFISLGPEVGFLVAAHSVIEFSSPPNLGASTDERDNLSSTNVALDAATGYEFPAGSHVGTVSLRYTRGLANIPKDGRFLADWQTRGLEFLFGMRW